MIKEKTSVQKVKRTIALISIWGICITNMCACSYQKEKQVSENPEPVIIEEGTQPEDLVKNGTVSGALKEKTYIVIHSEEHSGLLDGTEFDPAVVEAESVFFSENLVIHYIDVGQGDATLITLGDKAMLIDVGDNDHGTAVQNYLEKQGVSTLDYLVLTHPDADHIGGADVVITKFGITKLIMPSVEKDTATYRDVVSAMNYKNLKRTAPANGDIYPFGDAYFEILGPVREDYEDINDCSVALRLVYGDTSFLFIGDAGEEAEKDILESGLHVNADVYKAGHHGSYTSTYAPFIEAVSPKYAVISCSEDNGYGHPHATTLNLLRKLKVQVYRTDEQGTVIVESNGDAVSWNCSPSVSWKAGEKRQAESE